MVQASASSREIDVRAVLPAIHVPTLVIQRLDDIMTPPCHGRYLASQIPGARYFEQPGDHALRFAGSGDIDRLFNEVEDFLTGASHRRDPDRVLATILLAEAIDPDRASDLPQPGHLDAHSAAISQQVRSHRGRLRERTTQSILATFDAPGQANQSAAAIRADAAANGIQLRAGIHTGEVDLAGDEIGGISIDIVRRVTAHAQPAEILVSRTVKDLVIGSGVSFADRGIHELGAIPGQWQLFAVTTPQG